MPADIESTSHIIQGNWAYACHEDAGKVALELLEHIAVEAIGMGDGMIYFLTFFVEYGIGEVVVFVDDEIEGESPWSIPSRRVCG